MSIIPIGKLGNKFVGACLLSGFNDFFPAGSRLTVLDILKYSSREQINILLYKTDLRTQRLKGHLPDILSIDANAPFVHIVKPGDQVAQCSLSSAGGAYQSHVFPCLHI